MTEPNAADAAERKIAERAGGAEDGTPSGPGRGQAGKKRGPYKTRKAGSERKAPAKPAEPEEPITEGEIQMFALLGGVLWGFAARAFDMETLTEEERHELGAAMAPVARKYIPSLDEYAPEATLIIVVGGLIVAKKRKRPPVGTPVEAEADLVIDPPNGAMPTP